MACRPSPPPFGDGLSATRTPILRWLASRSRPCFTMVCRPPAPLSTMTCRVARNTFPRGVFRSVRAIAQQPFTDTATRSPAPRRLGMSRRGPAPAQQPRQAGPDVHFTPLSRFPPSPDGPPSGPGHPFHPPFHSPPLPSRRTARPAFPSPSPTVPVPSQSPSTPSHPLIFPHTSYPRIIQCPIFLHDLAYFKGLSDTFTHLLSNGENTLVDCEDHQCFQHLETTYSYPIRNIPSAHQKSIKGTGQGGRFALPLSRQSRQSFVARTPAGVRPPHPTLRVGPLLRRASPALPPFPFALRAHGRGCSYFPAGKVAKGLGVFLWYLAWLQAAPGFGISLWRSIHCFPQRRSLNSPPRPPVPPSRSCPSRLRLPRERSSHVPSLFLIVRGHRA